MKTAILLRACALIFAFGLFAAPGFAVEAGQPSVLKIYVHTPLGWKSSYDHRFPELFASSLRSALSTHGVSLPMAELLPMEDPAKLPLLLKVDITDWRITSDGDLSCTFTATLQTPQGERQIGVYKDTLWQPGAISTPLNRPYYPINLTPIQTLGRDLVRSGLLTAPGATSAS